MTQLRLEIPSERTIASYLRSLEEIEAEGTQTHLGQSLAVIRANPEEHVRQLQARERTFSEERVPERILWGIVDNEYVGRVSVRSALTENLWNIGGHIGYDVRPSARNKGYATAMLQQVLPHARSMGLLRVLLTCNETNAASRKVIERCSAHQIESVTTDSETKLRYWIPTAPLHPALEPAIEETLNYLSSQDARDSLSRDPYWPKWNSTWWHMVCLLEIGLAHRIPQSILKTLLEVNSRHYIGTFPFAERDVPPGCDPYRHTRCHCQAGTTVALLQECQLKVSAHWPEVFDWFATYQLPDGGFNCDGEAYLRERKVSSFVSTAPVLDALLQSELLNEAVPANTVDNLARFFIERQFYRSIRTGQPVRERWLTPIFPRFYEYDVLRGVAAVTHWMHRRDHWISAPWFDDIVQMLSKHFNETPTPKELRTHKKEFSLFPQPDGTWAKGSADSFSLLDLLSAPEHAYPFLRCQWNRVQWATTARRDS